MPLVELTERLLPFGLTLALVLGRVGAAVLTAPVLSDRLVPVRTRIGLTIAVSIALAAALPPRGLPTDLIGLTAAMAAEVMTGAVVGATFALAFAALAVAGDVLGTEMGFGMASLLDPISGHQLNVVTTLLRNLGAIIFLALDGHLILLSIVVRTLEVAPLGTLAFSADAPAAIAMAMVRRALEVGVAVGLPLVGAMLALTAALAAIARAAPQVNLFAESFPARALIGLFTLSFVLALVGPAVEAIIAAAAAALG